ncbi:MAG: hypothetical protein M3R55_08855 [Acidobacteriota bacterium]|nr:hypothetical protein [Acidobacteriota bacterium]
MSVALLALALPLAWGQAPARLSLGIVRADGVMIPFAQYDGRSWREMWTGVEQSPSFPIPISLEDVKDEWWGKADPALRWTLWRAPSLAPAAFTVTAPRSIYSGCGALVGLETDLAEAGPLPPPYESPYPKAGLATTGPVSIAPIAAIAPNDIEWKRVKAAVDRDFPRTESSILDDMGWSHPHSSRARNLQPIELQQVWHVKDSRFFYVEAMRRYAERKPPKGKPACDLVTFYSGWLWETREETLVPRGTSSLVTYCHMEHARFMWPFGVIREGNRQFWVVQHSGWTGESYSVLELRPSRGEVIRQAGVGYGACGRCVAVRSLARRADAGMVLGICSRGVGRNRTRRLTSETSRLPSRQRQRARSRPRDPATTTPAPRGHRAGRYRWGPSHQATQHRPSSCRGSCSLLPGRFGMNAHCKWTAFAGAP